MDSDSPQEQTPPSRNTRRSRPKRKADDGSKPPSKSVTKRVKPSNASGEIGPSRHSNHAPAKKAPIDRRKATPVTKPHSPRKSSIPSPSRNKSKQTSGSIRTRIPATELIASVSMTEKEKRDLTELLQKAKSSGDDIISQLQSHLQGTTSTHSDTKNRTSPKPLSKKGAAPNAEIPAPKSVPRQTCKRSTPLEEDKELGHDYLDTQVGNDSDDGDQLGSDGEEEILDIMTNDNDPNAVGPSLGESDAEQEVSYNIENSDHLGTHLPTEHDQCHRNNAKNSQRDKDGHASVENDVDKIDNGTRPEQNGARIDESVVLNIVQALKRDIFSQFDKSFVQVLKEIRTDREQIKNLRENLSEMTSIVTSTASAIFIKQPSANPRVKEIQTKLCLLNGLFNDNFLLKVLPRVVVGFLVTSTTDGSSYLTLQSKGIDYFSMLFFAKQPNEKKNEKFNSEVGKIYSKFRYSMSVSSFLAMQKNSFQTFRTTSLGENLSLDPSQTTDSDTSTTTPNTLAMLQPFWLQPGYVTDSHCVHVANKLEKRGVSDASDDGNINGDLLQTNADSESVDFQDSSQSSGKPKVSRSGPLTREEIANEAATMVYRRITSVLHRSRAATKIQLFHDVMYLFTSWSQNSASTDQKSVKIKWETERAPHEHYIEDLPRMKTISAQQRQQSLGQNVSDTDLHNMEQLEKIIASHPDLSLNVEHDVMVNGNSCRVKYRINLIEVACRGLSSYTTLQSAAKAKDVLCEERRSLKAIMTLAIGLRRLMERAVHDHKTTRSIPWHNNSQTGGKRGRPKRSCATTRSTGHTSQPEYKFEGVNGLSLDQLLPSPSKQKELLSTMILNLTAEEYDAKMQSIGTNSNLANNHLAEATQSAQENQIIANESKGVFGF